MEGVRAFLRATYPTSTPAFKESFDAILDHVLAHPAQRGIKAIILYRMNALAGDQARRFAKLGHNNPDHLATGFSRRYDGQEQPGGQQREDCLHGGYDSFMAGFIRAGGRHPDRAAHRARPFILSKSPAPSPGWRY
jgi:ATP-dependent helicase YprA (DUF1998 family)